MRDDEYTSRTNALTVGCPVCHAGAGELCEGARGKMRTSAHAERHLAFLQSQRVEQRELRYYDLEQNNIPAEHRDQAPAVDDPIRIPADECARGMAHVAELRRHLAARGLATGTEQR